MDDYTHIINEDVSFGDEFTIPCGTKVKRTKRDPSAPYSRIEDKTGHKCWVHDKSLTPRFIIENKEDLDKIINEK